MNTRLIGLIAGSIGVLFLVIALILGIMIGVNEQTQTKYWIENEDVTEDDRNRAEESNAFLDQANMGFAGFGMGMLFTGIGLAIAGGNRGNIIILAIAIFTILILVIGMALSIYTGVISKEGSEISNKDDYSDGDEKRAEEIGKSLSFLRTFNFYFAGFTFGSFGIGLSLFTILMGTFIRSGTGSSSDTLPPPGGLSRSYPPPVARTSTIPGSMPPGIPQQQTSPGGYNPTPQQSQMDQIFS